jgi:hypothetical protein
LSVQLVAIECFETILVERLFVESGLIDFADMIQTAGNIEIAGTNRVAGIMEVHFGRIGATSTT